MSVDEYKKWLKVVHLYDMKTKINKMNDMINEIAEDYIDNHMERAWHKFCDGVPLENGGKNFCIGCDDCRKLIVEKIKEKLIDKGG